jgi:hypothetical protein
MLFNFYSFWHKQPFKTLSVACLIIFVFSCFSAKAQYSFWGNDQTYGVALSSGYDVPIGNLGYTFKPALTYGLKVLKYYDNVTVNLSFGYHVYKPKQDTFYYAVDGSNYGTVTYQNFTVYSFYLGGAYTLEITEGLKAYAGMDLGVYYTHMIYHSMDEFVDNSADLNEEDAYLAPKLGLTYLINENIAIGVEGKYNLFAPTGQKQYNSAVGTINASYSGGLVLTYNF